MPNILPHNKKGKDSDYIWLRMDADSQDILDQLTPIAEGVIQDAVYQVVAQLATLGHNTIYELSLSKM